jgi:hypothetical protein
MFPPFLFSSYPLPRARSCDSSIVYSAAPSSNSARSARLVTLSIVDRVPSLPPSLTYEDDRRLAPCTHHLRPAFPEPCAGEFPSLLKSILALFQTLRLPSKPPHFPSSAIEFSVHHRICSIQSLLMFSTPLARPKSLPLTAHLYGLGRHRRLARSQVCVVSSI